MALIRQIPGGYQKILQYIFSISGAYFKSDNGLYYVHRIPGDPDWSGSDACLYRISKKGKISTAKNNTCFWPISVFVNSYEKRISAKTWNEERAEIEIVETVPRDDVKAAFLKESENFIKDAEYQRWRIGSEEWAVKFESYADYYKRIAASM